MSDGSPPSGSRASNVRARRQHWPLRRARAGGARRDGRGVRGLRSGAGSQGRGQAAAHQAGRGRVADAKGGSGRCARRRRSRGCRTRTSSSSTTSGPFEEKVFIAMEFVDGNTAGFWAQSQNRTWQETLKVYMRGGARAGGGARQGAGPPRLQARQRHGQPRRPGARHGLRARAPGREAGGATARRRERGAKAMVDGGSGATATQRLPAPLAEPGAPIAPLDGSTLVLTPVGRRLARGRPGDVELGDLRRSG